MKLIVKILGILIILVGVLLLIKPEIILTWIEGSLEDTSLYVFAIVARLILGTFLIVAAKESKYPGAIKFIGFLSVLAAVVFLFIGQESFHDFLLSTINSLKTIAPVSGLVGIVLGAFLIYAFSGTGNLKE